MTQYTSDLLLKTLRRLDGYSTVSVHQLTACITVNTATCVCRRGD